MKEVTDRAWKLRYGYPDWFKPETYLGLVDAMVQYKRSQGEFTPWELTPITAMPKEAYDRLKSGDE